MIDSLEMTSRPRIIAAIRPSPRPDLGDGTEKRHHVETPVPAERVEERPCPLPGLIPYKFGSSDGMFNLGSSLAFVQTLPPGVYISMNGRCFPWNRVRKDKRMGEFVDAP